MTMSFPAQVRRGLEAKVKSILPVSLLLSHQ